MGKFVDDKVKFVPSMDGKEYIAVYAQTRSGLKLYKLTEVSTLADLEDAYQDNTSIQDSQQ